MTSPAKPEAVWIVCGGAMQVSAVEAAHSLGLKAIVSDRNFKAPAMRAADYAVLADIYDVPGHLQAADVLRAQYRIVGVFTEGADCEVTVAALAEHLGLPGIGAQVAQRCKNKAKMRRYLYEQGLSPVASFETARLSQAIDWADARGYPVMVKAVDNCASRGTRRVDRPEDLGEAFLDAVVNSTTGTALLEEYLEGPQQSVEILFPGDGCCLWLNIVDRPFDGVLELGHVNPTGLGVQQQAALYTLTEQVAAAVGVRFGAFKCDTIWTKAGPRVLECTARLSGGFDCQLSTPRATGRNFIRAALAIACGRPYDPADLEHRWHKHCAVWAALPKTGKVAAIDSAALATPPECVTDVLLRVQVGDVIEPYAHCAQRPAFVAAVADTYAEALEAAQAGARFVADRIVTA
jgi:biotin carboxylase